MSVWVGLWSSFVKAQQARETRHEFELQTPPFSVGASVPDVTAWQNVEHSGQCLKFPADAEKDDFCHNQLLNAFPLSVCLWVTMC